jgi:transcriptional regulator with XRE-family HTH domain
MNEKPPTHRFPSSKPRAGDVDVVVGTRLRLRRRVLEMTQGELADALNIAQQQLQKYETGQNRISAARLYEAARILNAPVAWFYEGLDDPRAEGNLRVMLGLAEGENPSALSETEIESLLKAYASRPDGRQKLLQIMKTLIDPSSS